MDNPFADINNSVEQERRNKKIQADNQRVLEAKPFSELYEFAVQYYNVYDEIVRSNLEKIKEAYHLRADYNKYGNRKGDVVTGKLCPFYYHEGMEGVSIGDWSWGYPFKDSEDRDDFSQEWSVHLYCDLNKNLFFICRNHRIGGKQLKMIASENALLEGLKQLYVASFG